MKNLTYYGTFGTGHELAGHYQPILATNKADAEKRMFEVHGKDWAFVYSSFNPNGKTKLKSI